jgi:hypothetical protein
MQPSTVRPPTRWPLVPSQALYAPHGSTRGRDDRTRLSPCSRALRCGAGWVAVAKCDPQALAYAIPTMPRALSAPGLPIPRATLTWHMGPAYETASTRPVIQP